MIEQLQGFPDNVLAFACKDHVTRREYQTVLEPVVEKSLQQHDKVRLYYQVDPSFTGFEPGAMWEDLKVGMEHLSRWERIAVVTDVDWIRYSISAFGFLMPGALRTYPLSEASKAREWIVGDDEA